MKVRDLLEVMNGIAPWATQEPWDNSGLLAGDAEAEVTGVALCVDCTMGVIEAAKKKGANVILAHHPLLFGGTKRVVAQDYEGALVMRLICEGMALIAAHTNLDAAEGGVEDRLAQEVGILMLDECEERFLRVGVVTPQTAGDLLLTLKQFVNPQTVFYGDVNAEVCRVAVSCGGGGEFFREAHRLGAQAYITGEMKHHERIEAQGLGMQVMILGHEESERVVLPALQKRLAKTVKEPVFVC